MSYCPLQLNFYILVWHSATVLALIHALMPELLAPEWTDKADKAVGTVFLGVVVSGVLILWCSLKTEVEEIKLAERSLEMF